MGAESSYSEGGGFSNPNNDFDAAMDYLDHASNSATDDEELESNGSTNSYGTNNRYSTAGILTDNDLYVCYSLMKKFILTLHLGYLHLIPRAHPLD
jgi:hypothetical protein